MPSINKYNPSASRLAEMERQGINPPSAGSMSSSLLGGAAAASPWLTAAGLGLGAYGTYQQSQQAQKQYELAVDAWKAEQERQRKELEAQQQQQLLENIAKGGTYAQGLVRNAQNTYGTYARQTGL